MADILVADDDQLLRAIIRDHLERAGHAILEAGDGIAAMEIALEERPAVLLLDVMMPLARGLEVVRRVRREEGWHPTIVMISARTRVTDRLNALDAGADAYVEKPFAPEALLAVVERHLAESVPARYVDVLGPLWATLAVDRLARDAIVRRTSGPVDHSALEAFFASVVTGALGRPAAGPVAGADAAAMRHLWEDVLRALLRDVTEPEVPTVTGMPPLDAVAILERTVAHEALARHRRSLGGGDPLHAFWSDVLVGALTAPRPGAATDAVATHAATPGPWGRRLREVLGREPEPADDRVARWSGVLADVLRDDAAAVSPVRTVDPLPLVWLAAAGRPAPSGDRA
jgi:DNA-binding response OmpR family regulator